MSHSSLSDPARALALGYADNPLNRHSDRREDAAAIALWRARPEARSVVLAGEMPVLAQPGHGRGPARFSLADAAALGEVVEQFFLGTDDEGPLFATHLPAARADGLKELGYGVTDMRTVAVRALAPGPDVAALGMAKALFAWHETHRYCAKCGQPSQASSAGWRRDCPSCGAQHFPRTDPVVIMLAHRGDHCLLGRSPRFPMPMYSCLAGFMEPGETIESAVRRETLEETGIACGRVEYRLSQPWPFPMSLMIGCLAEAENDAITIDPHELVDARWFSRDETAAMLEQRHPDGLQCPPSIAIAHHLMRQWVDRR
ncbi:MAG: NAD(+) diphosphatase [Beijerinckiaceae bacterium]